MLGNSQDMVAFVATRQATVGEELKSHREHGNSMNFYAVFVTLYVYENFLYV